MTEPAPSPIYTAADAMLEGLVESGVSHVFANFGSDHPPIIEALARAKRAGRNRPRVVICPHESVGLAAAHGYALVSGEPQAVFVHVDVGTQTMGGAVHNAARSRVPVFIFAGETSFTMAGERFGTRNRPVQFIQDVRDQHSIVRPYVKWSYALRAGLQAKSMTYRGMQLTASAPRAPVYLTASREILEEALPPEPSRAEEWPPLEPQALPEPVVEEIVAALAAAARPLVVTSYAGRSPGAVEALARLAERLAVAVVETSASALNLPSDHPLHAGFAAEPLLPEADVVLVVDCDVPWVPVLGRPREDARVYHVDVDPLKEDLPVWHVPARRTLRADGAHALGQLAARAASLVLDPRRRSEREGWVAAVAQRGRDAARAAGEAPADGTISPGYLARCLVEIVDEETVLLDESITNTGAVRQQIRRTRPGTYFQSGGSALGWHGGAAIGVKLARPERDVVALTGDGSYFFSVPSTVHWMARRYRTPFLTVIFNNGGWNATKQNVLALHPDGAAGTTDSFWVHFREHADLAGIAAAAGGAFAATVDDPSALPGVLAEAAAAVRSGRAAVVDVRLPRISDQDD